MDLPPPSYHDSFEDFWDAEEDPEETYTMIKDVPYAYYHFLELFSKVKAEKLPSHCACDHHMELEGSSTFFKSRVRDTQCIYFTECRERIHLAKLLSNRSTCPLFQEEGWWPWFVC
ncbi:hypothetical protein O181_016082 [Austropuccinia psidii MF-1]|uniref:Uncharacterized protein n=1 Tax=Austropuccinia psidii MF-1 TaxID=1389203 RepID=A0A9Q3GRC3_9BASI|nr:hypothetical protein [Austropuccinia psidii MF-1]